MINYYKPESGIPAPRPRGFWRDRAKSLKAGDSMLVKNKNEVHSLISAIWRSGFNSISKKVDEGFRVWKMEK